MGITGELVKSVFSKNRSFGTTHDTNVMRNNVTEKKRWASVRSYLCGDEINSVLAEEDSASLRSSKAVLSSDFIGPCSARTSKATVFSSRIDDDTSSVKGSEATVTQPVSDYNLNRNLEAQNDAEKTILTSKHDAAVVIQSAFRSFQARRIEKVESVSSDEKRRGSSVATSVEVQTGNSMVDVLSLAQDGSQKGQHNKGARAQAWKVKEDWDDSTLSSNVLKMRVQNRLEASTRRERALAYAFSQQLRICSKKKQSSRSGNGAEGNMSWSWLERWMATKQHDTYFGDISKQFEQLNGNQKLLVKRAGDQEKESCGSNEVSMRFDSLSLSSQTTEKDYYKPARNRLKATNVSRRKTSPAYHFSKEHPKVKKKECKGEQRPKQGVGNKKEVVSL